MFFIKKILEILLKFFKENFKKKIKENLKKFFKENFINF